jgi:hypothetical protein
MTARVRDAVQCASLKRVFRPNGWVLHVAYDRRVLMYRATLRKLGRPDQCDELLSVDLSFLLSVLARDPRASKPPWHDQANR